MTFYIFLHLFPNVSSLEINFPTQYDYNLARLYDVRFPSVSTTAVQKHLPNTIVILLLSNNTRTIVLNGVDRRREQMGFVLKVVEVVALFLAS